MKRLAYCGRFVSGEQGRQAVDLRLTTSPEGNVGGFSGLQTCGSVWACAVCAEKINAERQAELQRAIETWLRPVRPTADYSGRPPGSVLFGTLTMRHTRGDRLADLWDAVSPAWNAVVSGAGWYGRKVKGQHVPGTGDKAEFGISGWVRVVETKDGEHGWHPHIHFLLFLERDLAPEMASALRARLFGRWQRALHKRGYDVLDTVRDKATGERVDVGLDLRPCTSEHLASYFTKVDYQGTTPGRVAYELTGSQSKRLGKGGRTPFQVLADVEALRRIIDVTTGEVRLGAQSIGLTRQAADRLVVDMLDEHDRAVAIWREWEEASRGRRQMTWSKGMRDLLALGVERTDEEIAEDDSLQGEVVGSITRQDWRDLRCASRREVILDALEIGGIEAVTLLLTRWSSALGLRPPVLQHRPRPTADEQPDE